MKYHYIFGPVPSRRLGMSLGVDLVPHKTCSMDCLYCECGKTTHLTLKRTAYIPPERITAELDHYFANQPDPDYITFSGSGEPSLNTGLPRVIRHIRKIRPDVQIAVLTNATLMGDPDVRQALLSADLVVPSLDAASQPAFERINRPVPGTDVQTVIESIEKFCRAFHGKVWLEVLILPGINDSEEDLAALKQAVHRIQPDMVQLNTLDRPGTEPDVIPATREELENIQRFFSFEPVHVIAGVLADARVDVERKNLPDAVMETLVRRPCTREDLQRMLNADADRLSACLDALVRDGKLRENRRERGVFYENRQKEDR